MTALTKEIEKKIQKYRDDFIHYVTEGQAPNLTHDTIEDDIAYIYKKIGLKKPQIIIADSHLAEKLLMNHVIENEGVGEEVIFQRNWEKVEEPAWNDAQTKIIKEFGEMKKFAQLCWEPLRTILEVNVASRVDRVERDLFNKGHFDIPNIKDQFEENGFKYRESKTRKFIEYNTGLVSQPAFVSFNYLRLHEGFKFTETFNRVIDFLLKGIWSINHFEKHVFITRMPTKIHLDPRNRISSTTDYAIKWRDGLGFNFIYGNYFEEPLWNKVVSKKMNLKEITAMSNVDQRMIAIDIKGYDEIIEQENSKLIDKSKRGNALYEVVGVLPNGRKQLFLKYRDLSTDRPMISEVPLEYQDPNTKSTIRIDSADKAMGWKFYLTEKRYAELKNES